MASRPPNTPSLAELDMAARHHGFQNYAQYQAWNQKYRQSQQTAPTAQPQEQPPSNWLQTLLQATPFGIVKRVSDRYSQATGQGY